MHSRSWYRIYSLAGVDLGAWQGDSPEAAVAALDMAAGAVDSEVCDFDVVPYPKGFQPAKGYEAGGMCPSWPPGAPCMG